MAARDAFDEDALGGLGRREAGEVALSAVGRGVARCENRSASSGEHILDDQSSEMQQGHGVYIEVVLQDLGVDLVEAPEGPTDGVMENDGRRAVGRLDRLDDACEGFGVRDVADVGMRIGDRVGDLI